MKQTQRHNGIIELVKQQGYVSTEELVEHFSVSPQTIRRDLNELAEQNLILRHHGGVRRGGEYHRPAEDQPPEPYQCQLQLKPIGGSHIWKGEQE